MITGDIKMSVCMDAYVDRQDIVLTKKVKPIKNATCDLAGTIVQSVYVEAIHV